MKRKGAENIMTVFIACAILGILLLIILFTTNVGFVQKGGAELVTSITQGFDGVIR